MTIYKDNRIVIVKFKTSGLFSFTTISKAGYGNVHEHGKVYHRSCIALFKAMQEISTKLKNRG